MQRFQSGGAEDTSTEPGSLNRGRRMFNEKRMGLAVAEWQAQQHDRALSEFYSISYAQPEWLNSQWVGALYSPGVAKTIEELKAEQKKKRFGHRPVRVN